MDVAVYLPFFLGSVLAAVTPPIARILPPRTGMWCLSAGAVVAAASWFGFLVIITFTGLGRVSFVADEGHWSAARWRGLDPVSVWVARAAGVTLVACVAWFGVSLVRAMMARHAVRTLSGAMGTDDTLVIVDDEQPHAYAIGGRRPRIVVSRGLLRGLSAPERRALLSHEAAHLAHRHDLHLLVVRLAAALNPLARRFVPVAVLTVERWADEETASAVGDRRLVARTLLRAALAGANLPHPGVALAHAGGDVRPRVIALLAAPPPPRRSVTTATTVLLLATLVSPVLAADNLTRLLDRAAPPAAVHVAHARRVGTAEEP